MTRRLCCTVSFLLGILLARSGLTGWVWGLTFLGLLWVWLEPVRSVRGSALLALCLVTGWARAGADLWSEPLDPGSGSVLVEGVVLEPPRRWGKSAVFFLEVTRKDHLRCSPTRMLVRWKNCRDDIVPGERWEFRGRLSAPEPARFPGGFSQKFWLWTQRAERTLEVGPYSLVAYLQPPRGWTARALACRLRAWMLRRLGCLEESGARALVAGVVFGETQSLPPQLQEQFRRTGTSHLLAASGMNVALLCGLVVGLARLAGYGPWRAAPWAALSIVAYAFLAGCAPSIVRATLGTLMALLAVWLGRTSKAWNSLSLSIWLLLLWEPRQIYDLGFQLSLAAVVGLVWGPSPAKEAPLIWKSTLLTISASLVTLPFFWADFGELSSSLLLSNLVLGPLVELLFPLGLLLALFPLPPLAWAVGKLAAVCLSLVGWLSQLSEPWLLAQPTPLAWALMFSSVACWLCSRLGAWRYLGVLLAVCALVAGSLQASSSALDSEQLRLRRWSGVVWVSTQEREIVFLREKWQEERARKAVRKMGCLREPEVMVLESSALLKIEWGDFDWQKVQPLLPESPFLEVWTDGSTYSFKSWSPCED